MQGGGAIALLCTWAGFSFEMRCYRCVFKCILTEACTGCGRDAVSLNEASLNTMTGIIGSLDFMTLGQTIPERCVPGLRRGRVGTGEAGSLT